jgi:hypothetical protein
MKRIVYIFLLIAAYSGTYAQGVELSPLISNRFLEAESERSLPEGPPRPDSLNLPFIEDFSYPGPYPDANLWLDRQVFVNGTMSGDNPSVGAATFDAIGSNGKPYRTFLESGSADTLTSNYINLANFAPSDSVLMSFFIQPKGFCYAPSLADSFLLEFRDRDGNWVYKRSFKGFSDSVLNVMRLDFLPPFRFITLAINEAPFFYGRFQFRFRNFGRLNGAYEQWHLDYVKIAANRRTASARKLDDLCFVDLPENLLSRYTSMPWKHAKVQLGTAFKNRFTTRFLSHFDVTLNPADNDLTIKTLPDNNTLVQGWRLFQTGQTLPPNIFVSNLGRDLPSEFQTGLNNIAANTEKFTLQIQHSLVLAGQEGGDFARAAFRNDTTTLNTVFSDYFAYDDGTAELQLSATNAGTQTVVRFRTSVADTLKGVMFYFPHINGDAATSRFNLQIWVDTLLGRPNFEKKNLLPFYLDGRFDSLQGFTTYRLTDAQGRDAAIPIGANKDFFIGWQNVGDVRIPIGYDVNSRGSQYIIQYVNGVWSPINVIKGALMIRPIFSKLPPENSNSVRETTPLSEYLAIYPNPANETLFVETKANADNFSLELFDILGRPLHRETLLGGQTTALDLSAYETGFYVLKVKNLTKNSIFYHKFVRSK